MKARVTLSALVLSLFIAPLGAAPAQALSCLPVDAYLKDIVAKDEIVVLVGTVTDQMEETDYTAEVLTVEKVMQGYAEKEILVYHEKSADWGYLCNAGPVANEGVESVYIIGRDAHGKYNVYQRLSPTDPLVATLEADLEEAEVTGTVAEEMTTTDRLNQVMTTINELIAEIRTLLKEYTYWKSN